MSKPMICQTIICKVKGITLLNLNDNNNNSNYVNVKKSAPNEVIHPIEINGDIDDDIEMNDYFEEDDNDDECPPVETSGNESKPEHRRLKLVSKKGIYEMEKVETSIESVRQYINTTRKNGKVWHQCRWASGKGRLHSCNYGSKWSGAMVNHIRSHLGVKPFRCLYCNKLFTIACNLKNHLRLHHGLKAKIILNGGRRVRQMSTPNNIKGFIDLSFKADLKQEEEEVEEKVEQQLDQEIKSSDSLKIFKPSFVNGKSVDTPSSERRTLPKRTVKKTQRYIDYEEDFEDEEDIKQIRYRYVDVQKAEEENRKFYVKTVEEEEEEADNGDDDASKFVVKRRYNKKLWFVCVWNPRQCKYRSHLANEVIIHIKKHQNIRQLICNWNHCSASFATQEQLQSHQLIHRRQKFFKCNFQSCGFQTINETALKMHKIRHKKHM